ncbi:IS4 family transposase [Streptomyces abikoensis]|uniref:IS4 family transposase n=1 Tax=Streptomyces abikoensis TaxID=97398 RepID=A0ABW7TBH9_9ACTN
MRGRSRPVRRGLGQRGLPEPGQRSAGPGAGDAEFFGRPGSARGQQRSAYPQVRVAALVECGTHAVFAAATGPLAVHEQHLIPGLLHRLQPGMLVLADRGITGFELWNAATDTGADLLWRVRKNIVLPIVEHLEDGSYLSEIVATDDRARRRHPAAVRVIEYTLKGHDDKDVYRLITTIRDPGKAPATELAALYHQRWEIENTLDEIKTHQGGHHLVLRSRDPGGVEQEVYGFLLVHHALRDVMHHTAHRLSRALAQTGRELLERILPPADHAPTPASSSARCPTGSSNTPTIATHPTRRPPSPHWYHPPNPPANARNILKTAVLLLERVRRVAGLSLGCRVASGSARLRLAQIFGSRSGDIPHAGPFLLVMPLAWPRGSGRGQSLLMVRTLFPERKMHG